MDKPKPKSVAEAPKAAAILGAILIKAGREGNHRSQIKAGEELLREAAKYLPVKTEVATEQKGAEPKQSVEPLRQPEAVVAKANLGDQGELFGKGALINITPEQEQKLMPILTRLFDASFRLGYIKFKEAARFVLAQLREAFGQEVADQITLDHLQGAYIGMAGRYKDQGADRAAVVAAVESRDDVTPLAPARACEQWLQGDR